MSSHKSTMLKQLSILAGLDVNSKTLYSVIQKTMIVAFLEPKPLFADNERPAAAALMENSMNLFINGFALHNAQLTVDKRELGQCLRSGLQYLVDEFQGTELYAKLQPMLSSVPVKNVEEFIAISQESIQDYPDFAFTVPVESRKHVPSSHYWWY